MSSITYLGSNNYTWSINGNDSSTLTSTNNLASNLNSIKIYAHDLGVGKTIGFDNIQVDSSVLNSNQTIYNTDVSLVDLTINSGATLTINSTGSLTVTDDFVNNGSIVMNSVSNEFPSLIVGFKVGSGSYTYNGMSQTLALSILFLLLLQERTLIIFCLITLVLFMITPVMIPSSFMVLLIKYRSFLCSMILILTARDNGCWSWI